MNAIGILIIALTLAWAGSRLKRDLASGMRTVLALLVFLPISLRIELPSGLPQLTVHRLLILLAFGFLLRDSSGNREKQPVPHLGLVLALGLAQLISLILGTQFVPGLKGFFSYLIEVVLFYVLVSRYVQQRGEVVPLLSSICWGLSGVAVLTAIQKYARVDPVQWLLGTSTGPLDSAGDIVSTYPHRILLGYALAMGAPIALALGTGAGWRTGMRSWGVLLLLIAATYYSTSRGPWLGLALAVVGMAVLGEKLVRKKLLVVAALTAIVLILRPGVKDTIYNLYEGTLDADSQKGGSYQTRWQLWTVAWNEVQKSPGHFLFGYGPVSTESMDLSDYFYGQEGWLSSVSKIGYTSWDNNYACDLFELGMVGFLLELALYGSIAWSMLKLWRRDLPAVRVVRGAVMVSCLVFMFAMTNVFIFAPQLKYLFWTLVAIGSRSPSVPVTQHPAIQVGIEEDRADRMPASRVSA